MSKPIPVESDVLEKSPTGITGLDEITGGGLPQGRPTLISGAAGAGKTLMAMEFLVHGARNFGEPGVFVAFEETTAELIKNTQSLGFDLRHLAEEKKIALDHRRPIEKRKGVGWPRLGPSTGPRCLQ